MKIKRLLSLFFAIIMVLSFAACGEPEKVDDPNVVEIGDYKAAYTGYEIVKDYNEKDTVVVKFQFTNNSEEAASFLWSFFYTVKQGDTELESGTVFLSEDSLETLFDSEMAEVAPGETKEVSLAYNLVDLTTDVQLDFTDLLETEKDSLTVKITE